MTGKRDHPRRMQLVKNTWTRGGECVLTTIIEPTSNLGDTTPHYLQKDASARTLLVIHLEADLSEKFKLNLSWILKRAPDPDNQDDTLYKASYQKLMDTLRNDDFLTADNGDKLWGFVPRGTESGWWQIRADTLLRLCLNKQIDCAGIDLFIYVINNGMSDAYLCAH